jgi:hypothetical protein
MSRRLNSNQSELMAEQKGEQQILAAAEVYEVERFKSG